ncbi:hypothetical protein [Tranquillimonas rosea]|uniref:hypothetical protein n=1 Tax=Tranquillimonas rosea TaxID=641238 RepID=UPI003BAC0C70
MTIKRPSVEEGARSLLVEAEAHYREALEDFLAVKLYLKDRDDLAEAEIKQKAAEYRRATQTLFDERKRLEDHLKRLEGIAREYALDFDAVRAEIGGRLDRLRAAGGAGEVPG